MLERGADGLGFSIVGGLGNPQGDLPIFVKTVFERGAAAQSNLKPGDQIHAVDAVLLEGKTHQEAVALLKNAKGTVTLTIVSWIGNEDAQLDEADSLHQYHATLLTRSIQIYNLSSS